MPAQQKAIVIESARAPFTIQTVPIPIPAKGEVLLKVISVGLNPMDPLRRQLGFLMDEYPAILGSDITGVVEDVGQGVVGVKKGDEVLAATLGGGYAQYVAVPAAVLIRKPANVTFDEVATYPITFSTACVGLFAPVPIGVGLNPAFSWSQPHKGKSALVIGAGTSVGQFAVQLYKFLGFTRIIAYAASSHSTYLTSLGATEVIDRHTTPLADLPVHASITVTPIDSVYDCTFGAAPEAASSLDISFDIVRLEGTIATVSPRSVLSDDRTASAKAKSVAVCKVQGYYAGPDVAAPKSKEIVGYLATVEHTKFGKLLIQELPKMLEKKVVVANRTEALPNGLEGIMEGLTRWEKGAVSGIKLVGHPQE